ncbi:MAG: GDP-L-fucose synthase [Betaproteobacteria bacterium]|nr:GDP-L-fucose synthase [Betaproteobacteria bacterium]
MSPESRIYVAGHAGLVGSAFVRELERQGYRNILTRIRAELDLTDPHAVGRFFDDAAPEYVFLAAAKVGGIVANNTYPAEFIATNLGIQNNVISEARRCDVRRLLFLGSSCIYPRDCPQPIREEYLLTGPLEATNRPYAIAKIAGVETCWAYNRQYGTQYLAVMPTNLYGPGDNYDLQNSHVLPALIRKVHTAKVEGASEVTLWGTGTPRREFLYTDDLAQACVFLMNLPDAGFSALTAREDGQAPLVNIGCGEDLTILELAGLVRDAVGYTGTFTLDRSKPDGTPQKLLSIDRIAALGWRPRTTLEAGIALAYADYLRTSGAA